MIAVAALVPSPHLNLVQSSGLFNFHDCLFGNIAKKLQLLKQHSQETALLLSFVKHMAKLL